MSKFNLIYNQMWILERLPLLLFVLYYVVHLPWDLFMFIKMSRLGKLRDYGIKHSEAGNLFALLATPLMWFYWVSISIFRWDTQLPRTLRFLPSDQGGQILSIIGALVIAFAVLLACWERFARGRYGFSWGLNDHVPLITHGPYRWIRHPAYAFYSLMFVGLPLFSNFWPLSILILGVFGYYKVIATEEQLLIAHFGDEYEQYQKRTGKLIPKFNV